MFFNLVKVGKQSGQYWKSYVLDFNITGIQAMVMNFMLDMPGAKTSEVAEAAVLDNATLTGILDRLEKRALLERRKVQGDRRASSIWLTSEGEQVARAVRKRVDEANKEYLSKLTKQERENFRALLYKLGN